jgi:hypothetical protein
MIKITIPAVSVREAVDIRDRIQSVILVKGETAVIGDGGVVITTDNPVRVCLELQGDGFI